MSAVCYLIAFICFLLALLGIKAAVNLELLGWTFVSLGLFMGASWGWPPWWTPRA